MLTFKEKGAVTRYIEELFKLADGLDERKKNSTYDRNKLIALLKGRG